MDENQDESESCALTPAEHNYQLRAHNYCLTCEGIEWRPEPAPEAPNPEVLP